MRCAVIAFLCFWSAPSYAQSLWDHNGSVVRLESSGAGRKFYYESPASGVPARSGTLLFEGKREGDRYSGTAYVFTFRCGRFAYSVRGPVASDQRGVTLYGKAPQLDGQCRVVGHNNDVLIFTLKDSAVVQRPPVRSGSKIRIGGNAFGFHPNPCGMGPAEVSTFPASNQVRKDFLEMLAYAQLSGVEIRESRVRQACALIGTDDKRYVLLGRFVHDKEEADEDEARGVDLLVLGHEIGHHACGHQAGRLAGRQFEKELEADRYGGMLLARMFKDGKIGGWNGSGEEFLTVIAEGMGGYGPGGGTHPPAHLRIQAVREGFYNGSNC